MTAPRFSIALTDAERALARTTEDKAVYLVVLSFRGPRGRRYRRIRTEAKTTERAALVAGAKIASRPYAHGAFCDGVALVIVDALSREVAREERTKTDLYAAELEARS